MTTTPEMPNSPPSTIIALAVRAATQSPCAKSKRGVVIFPHSPDPRQHRHASHTPGHYNGPPFPVGCDGSDACRVTCGRRCQHAEQRAIQSMATLIATLDRHDYRSTPGDFDLLHIEVDQDGQMVPVARGPTCAACSGAILDIGIRAVWLLERVPGKPELVYWHQYPALEFHSISCQASGVHWAPTQRA